MKSECCIVYYSPNGSTRRIATVIEDTLKNTSVTVQARDLAGPDDGSPFLTGKAGCLFIGSPVYRDTAIPPVMQFIEALPRAEGGFAVPFITWGGASSGVALWQMGQALQKKGYVLAGALSVIGVHSLMWQSKQPECTGHPDTHDLQAVADFIGKITRRLTDGKIRPLAVEALDYQKHIDGDSMKKKLGMPWMIMPKTLDEGACTQCGICRDECPVAAISLSPHPIFNSDCFDCFNCIRQCPEDALIPAVALEDIAKQIQKRVEYFDEDRSPRLIMNSDHVDS
ncbi:MAG: 4Fe-4S binding protein [Desulfobacteraceae bacterium]|nr:4Fe-4S binding protein [Desulfobacteraceae bacterium]